MLSEKDIYEQIQQMEKVEQLQRDHFLNTLQQVEDEKIRRFIQRFIDMENEHKGIIEELTSLYAQSLQK